MKKSGLQPAKDGCQVPAAVNRSVCSVPVNASDWLIIPNGDYRSGLEIGDYFVLLFSTDKFVGHYSLCFVSAAVVGEFRLACAVLMMYVTLPVAAGSALTVSAAVVPDRVTGQGGYCFVCAAMETCMMDKGKAEAACHHESDQED